MGFLNTLATASTLVTLVLICSIQADASSQADDHVTAASRCSFPPGFVFGTATAAYQNEGAAAEGGRGPSIWDTFAQANGKIADGSNGEVASDEYHRYKEDVELMKDMGMDAYRFSIAWPRIYPNGGDEVNPEGIAYYNALIDELLAQGIQPYVTLYHWDLPQALEDSMGGWLNSELVPVFARFAETCFTVFGDRVKHWITFNEPNMEALLGYGAGLHAPGRCSPPLCSSGNSSTEPYIVGHNMLLAHAASSEIYKKKFQAKQGGVIGITIESMWSVPYSTSSEDIAAAQRAIDFEFGWFADPIFFGDYPSSMRESVKERLPKFTTEQRLSLMNSIDFLGVNHYTTLYIADSNSQAASPVPTLNPDAGVIRLAMHGEVLIGPEEASAWFYIVPWGFKKLINYIKERYNNPAILILENGMEQSSNQTIHDLRRIEFYQSYLSNLLEAIRDGANVKGYFVWTLLDGWEWSRGYAYNFGFYYVDREDNLKRYPKESCKWFTSFLNHTCQERGMHLTS